MLDEVLTIIVKVGPYTAQHAVLIRNFPLSTPSIPQR
jgi:hypothetical protein